jgi:hypothetical protein
MQVFVAFDSLFSFDFRFTVQSNLLTGAQAVHKTHDHQVDDKSDISQLKKCKSCQWHRSAILGANGKGPDRLVEP